MKEVSYSTKCRNASRCRNSSCDPESCASFLPAAEGVTLTLQPASAVGRPIGDVAYMRMPLSLGAMASLEKFIGAAYGKDCVCTEDPKGWLKVSTPNPVVTVPPLVADKVDDVVRLQN